MASRLHVRNAARLFQPGARHRALSQRGVINRSVFLASGTIGDRPMVRIEKNSDGSVTTLRLSGRLQSDCIATIRSGMNDGCTRKSLNLTEVTLVDIAVVRFLISCENEGVEFVECPPFVREWMRRERVEMVNDQHETCDAI